MNLKVGDVVTIWPGTPVTVAAVNGEQVEVVWFEPAPAVGGRIFWGAPKRKVVHESKILGKKT